MAQYYERAMGGWGADYSYSHSYPGMAPAYIPSKVPPPAPAKPGASPKDDGKGARLIIDVPAQAKLYIDGQLSKSIAEQRQFSTPPLQSGQTYFYDLAVEVMKDGKPVTEEKRIVVRAGDEIRESFTNMAKPSNVSSASRK